MAGIRGLISLDGSLPEAACARALGLWADPGSDKHSNGVLPLLGAWAETRGASGRLKPIARGNTTLVWAGRLHNRSELTDTLEDTKHGPVHGAVAPSNAAPSDADLALAAYRKWGANCSDHLIGDWAFAAWDSAERRLLLARDHFGSTALYYHCNGRRLVFSSSLAELVSLPDLDWELDEWSFLTLVTPLEKSCATPWKGVELVPCGHHLLVKGNTVTAERYWSPADAPEIRYTSDDEYQQAFLQIYQTAVGGHLDHPGEVGLMLSSGLDSGSIAALAAPALAARGRTLHSFTSMPAAGAQSIADSRRMADESEATRELCRHVGNINDTYVDGNSYSLLQAADVATSAVCMPSVATINLCWILQIMDLARDRGLKTMLVGASGNFTVSWAGRRADYTRALVSSGRLLAATAELWRGILGRAQNLFEPAQRRNATVGRNGKLPIGGLVNADLLASVVAANRQELELRRQDGAGLPEPRAVLTRMALRGGASHYHGLGEWFGVAMGNPTADKKLMEFCLGIPQAQYMKAGRDRLLIRRAMQGRLPDSIVNYKRRGVQAADAPLRIAAEADEILDLFERAGSSALASRFIDLSRAQQMLARIKDWHAAGCQPTSVPAVQDLLAALGACLWLMRFEDGPGAMLKAANND